MLLIIPFIIFLGFIFFASSVFSKYNTNKKFVDRILNNKNYSKRENYIIIQADSQNSDTGYYLYKKDTLYISFFLSVPTLIWLPVSISDSCHYNVYESYLAKKLEEAERIYTSQDCYNYSS